MDQGHKRFKNLSLFSLSIVKKNGFKFNRNIYFLICTQAINGKKIKKTISIVCEQTEKKSELNRTGVNT